MSADANVFRWAIRRFFSKTELDAGALDTRYFAESEFINTSAGAGDAGKPVKLDAGGHIDATMLNDADVDHGGLGGLTDDDHSQYALLAGRSGGQTLYGGTASGNNLTLQSTSNATKGKLILGSASAYDEVNDRLGLGTTSPTYKAHVASGGTTGLLIEAASRFGQGGAWGAIDGPAISGWVGFGANFYYSANAPKYRATNAASQTFYTDSITHRVASSGSADATITWTDRLTITSSGVAATGALTLDGVNVVTTSGTQTLTNKTLTSPTITTPTISSTGFTNAQHAHTGASSGGQLDHGAAMTGLGDDDHTQYTLLAGRASGQTLNGGNAANEDLTIHGTAHATKTSSYVIIQPSGGQTIVGASSPLVTHPFEVQANNYCITLNPGFGSATNYVSSYTSGSPAPLALYGSRVFIDGDTLGIGTAKTPTSSADATGSTGDICWNSTHLFVKTGAGAWKRVALSTF